MPCAISPLREGKLNPIRQRDVRIVVSGKRRDALRRGDPEAAALGVLIGDVLDAPDGAADLALLDDAQLVEHVLAIQIDLVRELLAVLAKHVLATP